MKPTRQAGAETAVVENQTQSQTHPPEFEPLERIGVAIESMIRLAAANQPHGLNWLSFELRALHKRLQALSPFHLKEIEQADQACRFLAKEREFDLALN